MTSITFLRQIIINLEGEELVNQSITDAVFIDSNINKVVSSINNIANDENTISVLSARAFNLKIMSPEQQLALLEGNQNSWLNQGPDSSVSKNIMNPVKNTFLREFTAFDPRHQMIMVIDNLGGLVTASSRPESYDFRTYEFWEEVTSTRNIYISDPYIDEFTDALLITIAIPIFDKNSPTELLGMLVSNFDVKDIDFFGSSNILHNNEFTVIYTEDGNLVPVHSDHDHQTGSINDIDAFLQPTSQGNNWRLAYFNEEDSIVGWAFTRDANINPDSYVNWLVITHVNRDYVLQPVTTARNISLLLLVVVIFGSFGITFLLARMITQPLIRLTQTAEKIHEGQYDLRVEIESADEIGELGKTFNNMAEELSKLITGLEDTIQSRTAELEQRAVQMETSALVAREAASIQNVQELLDRTTHEISDRFGYYHAGIFLVDERGEYAVLQAANSSGGKRMLARGHKLQVGKVGVVGYAAGMAEPRIAQDVGADVIYYDNPDMPNTRSELALPLTVRGNVIGVLDVQSSESNAFMRNDVQALQILADQIALAIENARLIQGSKRALEELQTVYGQEALKAWQSVISGKDLAANYNPIGIDVSGEQTLSRAMTDGTGEKITKEITFRGQVIGNIDLVREREIGNWSKEEEALVEEILEQTALALENARLVNQIRLRSDQIQLLQEITSFAASLPQEEMLLEFIASKLFAGLNLNNCSIELFDSAGSICSLAASAPYNDGIGESCSIKGNEVTLEVIRSQQPSILYDIANNPLIKPDMKDMLTTRGTYSWVILPLIDRDEVVGAINLEFPSAEYAVKEQDLNLFNQISAQVSTALAGSRSFQAEQIGRESAAALLEITQIASSTLDLSFVLKEVSQRSAAALQSNRCTIFFLDDAKENLNPVISQFADPK
ncbi:MAG: GAF domain-containing protein, partial [Anaerolineae bacterium]|nr:GAF domain-containing protein [Anaerolineae bacterium]